MKVDEAVKMLETMSKDEQRMVLNRIAKKYADNSCTECPVVDICESAMMFNSSPRKVLKEY